MNKGQRSRRVIGAMSIAAATLACGQDIDFSRFENAVIVDAWNQTAIDACNEFPGTKVPEWPAFDDRRLTLYAATRERNPESIRCFFGDADGETYFSITWSQEGGLYAVRMIADANLHRAPEPSFDPAPAAAASVGIVESGKLACEIAEKERTAEQIGALGYIGRSQKRAAVRRLREKHGFAPGEAAVLCAAHLDRIAN